MSVEPKQLSSFDFPDSEYVPDGYDMKTIPKASTANFQVLVEEHNNLVMAYERLAFHTGLPQE